jgi:predicted P-loop ATPase
MSAKASLTNGVGVVDTTSPDLKNDKTNGIEKLLREIADFKYNTINGCVYMKYHDQENYIAYTDRMNRTIRRQLKRDHGLTLSKDGLDDIIKSDFSTAYDPMEYYFDNLPEYNSKWADPITQMASCVTTHAGEKWLTYFKKWMVASVANVYTPNECTNHQWIVLVNNMQGDGKSTFLNYLTPPQLAEYCYSGKINFRNDGDLNVKLSQNFIIHVEEILGDLLRQYENEVKEMTTRRNCLYRRIYEGAQSLWPRRANMLASLNDDEFLADTSGDRRFLVFRVQKIDLEKIKTIKIQQVWAQAKFLYEQGYKYYFDKAEIDEIQLNNRQFRYVSEEQELISKYFEVHTGADYMQVASHRFSASDIANFLNKQSKNYKFNKTNVGKAFKRLNAQSKQDTDGVRYFYLTQKLVTNEEEFSNPKQDAVYRQKKEADAMVKQAPAHRNISNQAGKTDEF